MDLLNEIFSAPEEPKASTLDELIDGLTLQNVNFMADYGEDFDVSRPPVATRDEANIVSSHVPGTDRARHKILLDLDHPAWLIPSSTEGNHHLYVDVTCDWDDYLEFLQAAAKIGLVEAGYVAASCERGYTSLRLPEKPKTLSEVLR